MAWDEWDRLKADAAAGSTAMRLNQADPNSGASEGSASTDLRTDKKVWAKAGEGAKHLDEPVGAALRKLEDGQSGLGDTSGCLGAAAQKELYDSWSKYVKGVRQRCKVLAGLLESAGHDLSKSDESLKSELNALKVKYADTEAVGGTAKGQ